MAAATAWVAKTTRKRTRLAADGLDSSVLEKIKHLAISDQGPPRTRTAAATAAVPEDAARWAAFLLGEACLATAKDTTHATRARIAGVLSSLETRVRAKSEAEMRGEMDALRSRVRELSRENDIIKHEAVVQALQRELSRRSEGDLARVIPGLREEAARQLQHIRELEDDNEAVTLQLIYCQ